MQLEFSEDVRGRRVAVKRAETSEEAARLRREADLLDVATHPALVEVLAFDDGPGTVLQTAFVGPSLTAGRALEVDEIAGVVAAVASTLADLHEMGLVHGSVALDHVLLDDDGRPVLCSLGCGGLAGERPPAGAGEGTALLDPAIDVFGLGVVLAALLARANGRTRTAAGDALRRLADSAMAAVAPDRPTARRLADAVHDAVPGARLPLVAPAEPTRVEPPAPVAAAGGAEGARPLESWRRAHAAVGRRAQRRRRLRGLAGALAGVAAAGVGFLLIGAGQSSTAAPPVEPDPPEPATTTTAAVVGTGTTAPVRTTPLPTGSPTTAWPPPVPVTVPIGSRPDCPVLPGPLAADVDGDGCAESIRYVAGVVEAGGARWAVGEPEDVVAVGDWSCSGTRSLAVLRPRTGEVFTFDGWATAGHEVRAPLLARVPGGQTVRAADLDADGCNELVVERATGAPAVLRAPRVRP